MNVRPGDAILLIAMLHDPDPIEPGATGTVLKVGEHGDGDDAWRQITVAWDNGRQLMVYICEGTQLGFGNKRAWDTAGQSRNARGASRRVVPAA